MAFVDAQSDVFGLLLLLIWLVVFGLLLSRLPADTDRKQDETNRETST